MNNSTHKARSRKPADRPKKPYKEFPLYPHPLGYWAAKVAGKLRYYGRWARVVKGVVTPVPYEQGWQEALTLYKAQIDEHKLGRDSSKRLVDGKVNANAGGTVGHLCNHFMTAMLRRLGLTNDEITTLKDTKTTWLPILAGRVGRKMSPRMIVEYKAATERLVNKFGANRIIDTLGPDDFAALARELDDRYGPVRFGNEIQKVRTIFKYGQVNRLFERAMDFGSEFKKPDRTELRKHRAKNGKKTIAADQLRALIDAATPPLKAMLLLGINAAFGNHDIATLPLSALDLDDGWVNYARPKTGIARKAALWPETISALRDAMATRPEPRQDDAKGLVFVTSRGRPWLVNGIANPVCVAARDLMKTLDIHNRGIGFYSLRHTFRTVADATKDPNAIRLVMGHTDASIDANYTHGIEDARLVAVAEHVRRWLWPDRTDEEDETETEREDHGTPKPKEVERIEPLRLRLYAG